MWTSPAGDRGTTINRVRLRGAAGRDALAAELRASRAIEQVADVPLPAGAILCVRHLRDPRPRCLSLSPVQAPSAAWARAVAQALADVAGRAARPAKGPVDGDAEAVIFDDRAQMLACLAADWCRGSIAARWWWRALIGTSSEAEAVLRAWRQHPSHIAAALEEAARLGVAPAFVRRLPERATVALLEAVVAAHGLSRQLISSEPDASPVPGMSHDVPRTITLRPADVSSIALAATLWRRSAPEACDLPLRIDQQLLLGVALTVRRHPARARNPIFAADVAHWRRQLGARHETAVPAPVGPQPTMRSLNVKMREARRTDSANPERKATAATSIDEPPDVATQLSPATSPPDVGSEGSAGAHALPQEDRTVREVSPDGVTTVDTGLGGIFYLLNVALALGLYGDFTAPRAPQLDLSIWRFIALAGEALLRGRHRRDPLWRLLTGLAGPNLGSINESAEWRLNPAWLAAFPEPRVWRWSADAARLRVRHPAGFLVLDVRRSSDRSPAQQVRDEIEIYRPVSAFRLVHSTHGRSRTETELARWTRWHAAYTRARLERALGVPRSRVGTVLCRHCARVRLSLTHVDVTFPLASLPIAIRSSGLDRDPGWIPAADRIVSFRYD